MKAETIALFDMDVIAYRSAAAVEKRSVKVTHLKSKKEKSFSTRTEFKKYLKEKDWEYNEEEYKIEDIQTVPPLSHALQVVKSQVNKIRNELGASTVYGYIGKGSTNFRLALDLPVLYKGNRTEMLRPVYLDETKKYIVDNYLGGYIEGIEVDDEVTIRSHELIKVGHRPVIITIDKDTKGSPGVEFYDWTQDFPEIVKVKPWGWLDYNKAKNKVDGLGLNFFCYQMLHEDAADGYGINDLHNERFGATSVVNYLNQAENINDLFALTEAKYKEWFGESFTYTSHSGKELTKSYKEILELYFQVVYMKRYRDDRTTFYSMWKEFK